MLRALERRLHSATAAPTSFRCIRRRRRSTPQPLKGEPLTGSRVKPPLPGEVAAAGRRKGGNFPGNDYAAFCKTPQSAPAAHPAPLKGEPLHGGVKTPPYRATRNVRPTANIFPQTHPTGRLCAAPTACRFRQAAFLFPPPVQNDQFRPATLGSMPLAGL